MYCTYLKVYNIFKYKVVYTESNKVKIVFKLNIQMFNMFAEKNHIRILFFNYTNYAFQSVRSLPAKKKPREDCITE